MPSRAKARALAAMIIANGGGLVRVAEPPKPEWSNATVLTDEFAAFERERTGK